MNILKKYRNEVYFEKYGLCIYWEVDVNDYWVSIRYISKKGFWGYCCCVAAQYKKPCKHLHFAIDAIKKEEGL